MKQFGKTVLAAVLGGAITLGTFKAFEEDKTVMIERSPDTVAKTVKYDRPSSVNEMTLDFTGTAERVTPAVVHIRSEITRTTSSRGGQEIPPIFRYFFDDQVPQQRQQMRPSEATGSGVIISKDGYILTNNHVIESASKIEVMLHDKRTMPATVIGIDPTTDLAVIKIDDSNLPTVPMGNSDNVRVGEWVLAVGNPFRLESTVTAGIVSAKGRNINILKDSMAIESFIQTDAAVNPGNSGGALVNLNGELIGINTAIASPTGSYSGYAFAVPSNMASKVVEDLITYGNVQRGLLGVRIMDVNSQIVEDQNLKTNSGVFVASVGEGSGADEAGLEAGDVIIAINGKDIKSSPELQETIGTKRPGDEVSVKVLRGSKEFDYKVKLQSLNGNQEIVKAPISHTLRELGADFKELSKDEKEKYGVDHGVQITRLLPGKLRAQTNIQEGFIVTRINKTEIKTVEDLVSALEKENGGVLMEGKYPGQRGTEYFGFGM
ncbi:Do family serine endopeptidase [Flammeovirgaceae bacterium SG7u.111]|nr:Do family serine endopeptidase [Flammeovirgaceae bacterium SG7u.132]WPO34091.1 Do family serine endopeptidase [Flammeovirgaceae bacterium SG7u.111]